MPMDPAGRPHHVDDVVGSVALAAVLPWGRQGNGHRAKRRGARRCAWSGCRRGRRRRGRRRRGRGRRRRGRRRRGRRRRGRRGCGRCCGHGGGGAVPGRQLNRAPEVVNLRPDDLSEAACVKVTCGKQSLLLMHGTTLNSIGAGPLNSLLTSVLIATPMVGGLKPVRLSTRQMQLTLVYSSQA